MDTVQLVEALRSERARAQGVVDGCTLALAVFEPMLPPVSVRQRIDRLVRGVKRRRAKKAKRAARVRAFGGGRVAPAPVPAADSKVSQCRAAILAHLKRYDSNGMADSTTLVRACGKDAKRGDVYNALQDMKKKGFVERSGDVWAITDTGRAA